MEPKHNNNDQGPSKAVPREPQKPSNQNRPQQSATAGSRPSSQNSRNTGGGGRGSSDRRRGRGAPASGPSILKASINNYDEIPVNKSVYNGSGGTQATQVKTVTNGPRVANQAIAREPVLRIVPLGGLGEIGKNMTAIEYGNDIIIVDIGFMFPTEDQPGIDYVIPDVSYLEDKKHKIRGIVITHGHMDHIGGVAYVLPKLPAPLYGTRLSLGMVEKQLEEFKLQTAPQFRVMDPDQHETVQLGTFKVELVRVTHSIPDATAVVITTAVGTVIHTGDWRLDPDPIDGRKMDMPRFAELGQKGVLLLMSDSTRCDFPGRTASERDIESTFEDLFKRANGRVIISTFASSMTRIQLIVDAAQATKRKLAFVGRSMLTNVELAVKLGYIKVPSGLIIRVQDVAKLSDTEVVVLCTGSQGEINSALNRMSTGDHPHIKIKPGDSIIYSASPIPGNEKAVVATVDALMREGAHVYQRYTSELDHHGLLHCSGHASHDDVVDLLEAVRPKYFMPIHGEFHHLVRNADIAVETGIPRENVFVIDNGDVLEFDSRGGRKGARVPAGKIMIDGTGVGDVEGVVLRDRLAMASDGIFVIVATVARGSGKLITSPDIISRGFIYMKENEELVNRARAEVRQMFERRNTKEPTDWSKFKLKLRDQIGDFLYNATKRNPMIITVINEV